MSNPVCCTRDLLFLHPPLLHVHVSMHAATTPHRTARASFVPRASVSSSPAVRTYSCGTHIPNPIASRPSNHPTTPPTLQATSTTTKPPAMEVVGSFLMTFLLVKFNNISEFNLAHRLLNGLRLWVPPSEEDVNRLKKVGSGKAAAKASGKAKQRAGKGGGGNEASGSASKGAEHKLHELAAERVEQLELKQALVQQGMLLPYRDFPPLDRIVLFFCLAVFMSGWQELYRLAHPTVRLFKLGSMFVGIAAAVALGALLDLVWKRRVSRTATTLDFSSALAWLVGILSVVFVSAALLAPKDSVLTFHLDSVVQTLASQCYTFAVDVVGVPPSTPFLVSGAEAKQCPIINPLRLLLIVVATIVAVAHVPSALTASFAVVNR